MRANVYIDGFNLYYGIRRWPGSKWLDVAVLAARLFPHDEINRIRYFTAHVKGRRTLARRTARTPTSGRCEPSQDSKSRPAGSS